MKHHVFFEIPFEMQVAIYSRSINLQALGKTFLKRLANQKLCLPEFLKGLKCVAAIYRVPLDITPIMRQSAHHLSTTYKSSNELEPAFAKDTITTELAIWTDLVLEKLHDGECHVQRKALTYLKLVNLLVTPDALTTLIKPVLSKLNDSNCYVYNAVLAFLTVVSQTVTQNTLAILIEPIFGKLDDSERFVRRAALECLMVMSLKVMSATLATWINPVLNKLYDSNEDIRLLALRYSPIGTKFFNSNKFKSHSRNVGDLD